MQKIFLAYANSQAQPLPTLTEEDKQVYRILAHREQRKDYSLYRDSYTTLPEIANYLNLYQDDIIIFHYSGHAETNQLLLEDSAANAVGIAQLLGRCKKLQLVILNGCSTRGQVDQLLAEGVPAVIATSAAVGDRTATQFAISFYQSLAVSYRNLGKAFEDAVAAAQTQNLSGLRVERYNGNIGALRAGRQVVVDKHEPLWCLYTQEAQLLQWKLPLAGNVKISAYVPSKYLVTKLVQALAPYDNDVEDIAAQLPSAKIHEDGDVLVSILRCLPHPISQQLRKLLAADDGGTDSTVVFFDKADTERLWQLGYTYATIARLLIFTLMADLWRQLEVRNEVRLNESVLEKLRESLISRVYEQESYDFILLIRNLLDSFKMHQLPYFLREFLDVSAKFEKGAPLVTACRFLESIQRMDMSSIEREEAVLLCARAEEELSTVFDSLGFLAGYNLISVRNIDLIRYRAPSIPKYKHKLVRLQQNFVKLSERHETMELFMDTCSILLQPRSGDKYSYLNLSPFVIDQSAFEEKPELTKILYFEYYDKDTEELYYRHVYKPRDAPLVVGKHGHLNTIWELFSDYTSTLFKTNL
jgi:CHAT domain